MAHIHENYDFTVSAYVLHPSEAKIALHFHKKLHKWLQFGGHVELDEDPEQALTHELLEEAGFAPKDYEIIQSTDQPHPRGSKTLNIPFHYEVHQFADTNHKHIDMQYLVKAKIDKFSPKENESKTIAWFTLDEINKLHIKDEMNDGTLDICTWIFKNFLEV